MLDVYELEVKDNITLNDEVEVTVTFNLETLLYELALENLERAQKSENRLQRIKYSAATIIFAQATVEAYFNWILETRLISHVQPMHRFLGDMISGIYSPAKKRWTSIIQAIGLLNLKKYIEIKDFEKKSDELTNLRNPIIHYYPKFISLEKLRQAN